MTLRARLAVFVAAAVGITVVIVAVASYRSARDEAIAEMDRFLRGRAPGGILLEALGPQGGQGGQGRRQGPFAVVGEDVIAQVLFEDGTVFPLGSEPVVLPALQADLDIADGQRPDRLATVTVDGVDYRMITRRAGPGIAVQVARDLSETEAILAGLRNRLLLIGLAGALIAGVAGWFLAKRAVRPVGTLTEAAEQVAATGALDTAIPVERKDEIGRLAAAFNEMLARLQTSRAAQQRLVTDASHELRTPLTSLRTNIELLVRGAVPEKEQRGVLADVETEVAELAELVAELVDLATVGRPDEPKAPQNLADVLTEAVERARRRSSVEFILDAMPVTLEIRPTPVLRAVSNLLDNAAKWSPDDGTVKVELDESGLTVTDSGAGFDPADIPFVFQRFYRATTARSLPGSGLGLAIVAAVAEDHGWGVFARNGPEGGGQVGLIFGTEETGAKS